MGGWRTAERDGGYSPAIANNVGTDDLLPAELGHGPTTNNSERLKRTSPGTALPEDALDGGDLSESKWQYRKWTLLLSK